jgi:proline racemase
VKVQHPTLEGINHIAYVMFRHWESNDVMRTCTTLKPGRIDRSPCGTGSSANLATLYARGLISIGDARISRSIIGGEFRAQAIAATQVGGHNALVTRITGSGYVYGRMELRVAGDDPFRSGFALSDTWGPQVDLLNEEEKFVRHA